jgi:hypothetical protein
VSPRPIEIEIQELVLHGFPPVDRAAIADVLARELGTALAADVGSVVPRNAEQLYAPSFTARDLDGATVGASIAASVKDVLTT